MTTKKDLLNYWKGKITDKAVIRAFKKIPREEFMLPAYKDLAYEDNAFPILAGQTISQPTTVMLMLQALELKRGMKVLEIGGGSGYNTALLQELVGDKGEVISTEIIPELVKFANNNLKKIKSKARVIQAKELGYKKKAPYDRIIVTAGAEKIPKELIDQLKEGGIILIPVGINVQTMIKGLKKKGKLVTKNLGQFLFVPLVSKI